MLSRRLRPIAAPEAADGGFADVRPCLGREDSFSVRRLSLIELHKLAAQRAFGSDTKALWPGLRRHVAHRLAHRRTFVVAALSTTGMPACWAGFRTNRLDAAIWHYGNLFTEPTYRRRGLAQAVVRAGASLVLGAGGRRIYCFVDERNRPSVLAHAKLGFRTTRLMKSQPSVGIVDSPATSPPPGLRLLKESELIEKTCEYMSSHFADVGDPDPCVILDAILPNRSVLRWRRAQEHSVCLRLGDIDLCGRMAPGGHSAFLGLRSNGTWSAQSLRMLLDDPVALSLLGREHSALFHEEWGPEMPSDREIVSHRVYALDLA
jgi:GNAT superfamily N-acetyltransferase